MPIVKDIFQTAQEYLFGEIIFAAYKESSTWYSLKAFCFKLCLVNSMRLLSKFCCVPTLPDAALKESNDNTVATVAGFARKQLMLSYSFYRQWVRNNLSFCYCSNRACRKGWWLDLYFKFVVLESSCRVQRHSWSFFVSHFNIRVSWRYKNHVLCLQFI